MKNSICLSVFMSVVLLSGCVSGTQGPVETNRLNIDVQRDGVTITGRYAPAGFSSSEAKKLVSELCEGGGLASYSETPTDGQVALAAQCSGASKYGAWSGTNFVKTGGGTVESSTVTSQNGSVVQIRDTHSL